jgi:predicted HicB family RNase H-like nuclease
MTDILNREFAKSDENFIKACEKAGVQPTRRQASKFRRGFGLAFKHRKGV